MTRTRLTLSVALVAALAGGGWWWWSFREAPPADPVAEARTLEALARSGMQRIELLTQRPWRMKVPFLENLVDTHTRLLALTQEADLSIGNPDFVDSWIRRARNLVDALQGPLAPCLDAIEAVAPTADRVHTLAVQIQTLMKALTVPPDAVFVLRTRWQDGWLRNHDDGFRFLSTGLDELRRDPAKDTHVKVAARGLAEAAASGQELYAALDALSRTFQLAESKLLRQEKLLPWGRTVLDKARDPRTTPPIPPADLATAQSALDVAAGTLDEFRSRWASLRVALAAASPAAPADATVLLTDLDAARLQALSALRALAFKLGLKDPE